MTVRLNGSSSGYVEIDAPPVGDNSTAVLPLGGGTLGRMVLATSQASTSGTSIDFTGIPSWAKRVSMIGANVSTSGTGVVLIQLGTSGGYKTTGYSGSNATSIRTAGITIDSDVNNAAAFRNFIATINLVDSSTGTWIGIATTARTDISQVTQGGASVALAGTLDRIRLYTTNGTDLFDGGVVNILYEG